MIPAFLLQATPGPESSALQFLPLIAIFGIFYFLLLRPVQRQRKQQQRMLSELQTGQMVMTNGGIIGTIVSMADDTVVLRVRPDNVKLTVARSSVAGLVTEEKKD